MATGSFLKFNANASHHAVFFLLVLGDTLSLANHTNATVEVEVATFQKLHFTLGPCETRSLRQRRLRKNCMFGTATSFALCCATEDVAFLIRRHPPRSASFACIGSHPSLANRTNATVEVEVSKSQNPRCAIVWAPVRPHFCSTGGCARTASFTYQRPWSRMVQNRSK